MEKSAALIPLIIGADNEDKAIDVLNKTVEALHLSQSYYHLVELKDSLDGFQQRFKDIRNRVKALPTPRAYQHLHELRMELNFLHMEANDELAFEINKSKIFHEERKTVIRAESMEDLAKDEEFQKTIKAKSPSALRDVVGASSIYKQYASMASVSYGLYSEFHKMMESIKLLTDSLASECKHALHVEQKDAH